MLKVNLIDILSEPNATKCDQLNTLLDSSSVKDLYNYVEYIINFILCNNQMSGSQFDFGLNGSHTTPDKWTNWPLKLKNKSQNALEHHFMFKFLCTKSSFWLSLFKLENYGAVFRLPVASLPHLMAPPVHSYLASKADSFNMLNLTPLEYYLLFFLAFVHDTRTQSRKVYNQHHNHIQIDSVYGDLLSDYLNFFLPLDTTTATLDQLNIEQSQPQPQPQFEAELIGRSKYEYVERASLFKKCYKKPCLAQFEQSQTTSHNAPPTNTTKSPIKNTIKNTDTFLRLINETLVFPFSGDQAHSNTATATTTATISYKQTKQNLTSLECLFTLSIIIRHSHYFSHVLYESEDEAAPLAELRHLIFKIYWRKSFYKFFKYNLEHWPFDENLKWLIELWLNYVEPSKHHLTSMDFICHNYLIIGALYQLILKRFCLVDLTCCQNSQLIANILQIFVFNKENLKKCDLMYMHVQSRLSDKTNRQDAIRQSAELNNVLNMFQEVDESIACFHFLNDLEHIKMVNRLYEILTNAKWMMNQRVTSARNASSLEWFKSMFVDEQQVQFAQMSEQECVNSIKSIDRCLQMIRMFYEERASFEEFESEEQQVPSEQSETGDYESGEDRMVKLTPKGRFRVINRIRKANVETSYDPEQAAIGDFEIRFLVYVCQFVSDLINENFLNFFQKVYNRNDTVGRVAKKCLYVSKRDGSKPKLNLRHLASYKFVFYFFVYLLLLNVLTGYSLLILVPFVLFIYFAYFNLLV